MKSAVTVSLVEQARGGPFVYWSDVQRACAEAARLGFDAIELFAPDARAVDSLDLAERLDRHGLALAAVGTGAGKLIGGLTLTDPDPQRRAAACAFVRTMIECGAPLGAPAIIGSMQGHWGDPLARSEARDLLADALHTLGEFAASQGVVLLYEPLNRYESNLGGTLEEGGRLVSELAGGNVRLLADLFHMNIEETDLPTALRAAGPAIGHVHFVDSNRRAAGWGHTDLAAVVAALRSIGYDGYLSAEALPWPSSDAAAEQTIKAFHTLTG